MKAALIPPVSALPMFGHGDFHLLLSHLVDEFPEYAEHYKAQRAQGAYLVLDNSAHEHKKGESASKLAKQAVDLQVQEVVVPDVLFDASRTVESALKALEVWFEGRRSAFQKLNPCLMYVPQGRTEGEWKWCLEELIRIHKYVTNIREVRTDFTVGLSKDYEMWDGGLHKLVKQYLEPLHYASSGKVRVHMLGWGRQLARHGEVAHDFPWVRSTDSAKPFVYALSGIELYEYEDPPEYPGRPEDYFSVVMNSNQVRCARRNAALFAEVVR